MTPDSTPKGWRRMRYGDALAESEERAGERTYLPVLSVTKTRGPMLASERFGKAMHGRDLTRYRIAPRNHIVADPMLLWDGSIGVQKVVDAGLVSPDYRVYKPTDVADPVFMAFLVRSPIVQPYYQGGARGTNVRRNRIARSHFLSIPLLLPPLGEQRKIAAILSSMDDAIEATQAVIDQLQVVKKAMMAELLTRGLPGRHTHFKQTEIGEVPEEWEVVPLGNLLVDVHAGWSPQCESSPAGPDDWGVLKVSAVSWDEFRAAENKRLPATFVPRPEIEVKVGDLLVSRANTPELVGRSVYVAATRRLVMLSDKIMRLVPDRQRADPRFINFVLGAPVSRDQIENAATGSSRSMKNLSQEKLRGILVVAPPLAEQTQIMGLVDSTTERNTIERDLLAGMQNLKSALMSVLLTGELRVTPDEAAA